MKSFFKYAMPLLASACLAGPAAAYTLLTLTDVSDKNTTNPQDVQCVMYGNSCPLGQQLMDDLNYKQKGSETEWVLQADPNQDAGDPGKTVNSPYTVAYLSQFVGKVFGIGIDVNTTQARGETLDYFEVLVNGTVQFAIYDDAALNPAFNGNGYFDFTLTTVDLSSFKDTDTVVFKTRVYNQSDGAENFFLYRLGGCELNCTPVPEPSSMALIGLALAGFGLLLRRRV